MKLEFYNIYIVNLNIIFNYINNINFYKIYNTYIIIIN